VFSEAEPKPIINLEKLSQSNSIPKLSQLAVVDSAVWGTISIGGGHSNMEELFYSLQHSNFPVITLRWKV
jgi:hypothetical protein